MSTLPSSEAKRRQKQALFRYQKGKCYWCHGVMVLVSPHVRHKTKLSNLATLDHLDDRFSPLRGSFTNTGIRRRVLACASCNEKRGRESQAAQGMKILRERAQRHST